MKKIALLYILIFITGAASAHVTLAYPEGGETFSPGEEVTIEWEELVMHDTQNWDLYYTLNGGDTWEELAMDLDYVLRTYTWTVPETSSSEARIKVIQDNTGFDYEDESGDFTIMSPVGTNENSVQKPGIFPNPASDHVFLKMNKEEKVEIRIRDMAGNLIFKNQSPGKIDLKDFKAGIYICTIITADSRNSQKLLIRPTYR